MHDLDIAHGTGHIVQSMDLLPFRQAIEDALRTRNWSLSRLGREAHIQASVISRWLNVPEGSEASRPSPRNLAKLAPILGTPYEDLMRLCDYLPGEPREVIDAKRQAVRDQLDRWLTAVGPEHESLFWDYLKAHGDSTVSLIRQIGSAVSAEGEAAVNRVVSERPERGRKRRGSRNGPLEAQQHAAKSLLSARRHPSRPAKERQAA